MIFKVKNNKVNFLFFLMALIIAASAGGGADYVDYLRWADYFKNNNIEELKIYQKSENGLPLVSWYYGSGLIAGFINKILFVDGLLSMKINSIILALLNIFLLNKILIKYNILKLSNFFVICIFILILPAGYYINKYSTETWTIFLTLLSIFFYEEGINKNKKINLLLIGISAYFLILVKITNIFLAISLLSLFFFKELSKNNKNLLKKIISFCSVSFFVILGIILVLIYHKLLLGSYFTSFYSFGDDTFQTFSIHNFKIFEVLFSTWHGLLLYHPVYLFINLVLLFFFLKKNINIYFKFLILINIFLFASQLLIQASHFFWFMGTGTYGARGFAGISVITFYLILNFKDEFRQIKISFFSKFFLVFLLIWQSYMMSMGVTNFATILDFLNRLFSQISLFLFIKIFFIVSILFFIKKKYNHNFLKFFVLTSISLVFFVKIDHLFTHFRNESFYLIFLFSVFSFFLVRSTNLIKKKLIDFQIINLFSAVIIFIFLNSLYFQYNLFYQFKNTLNLNFKGGNNFNCNETIQSLIEYNGIKGYETEKELMTIFLEKNC